MSQPIGGNHRVVEDRVMTQPDLAILYEHPEWFRPLFAALDRAGIHYEAITTASHSFDPAGSPEIGRAHV